MIKKIAEVFPELLLDICVEETVATSIEVYDCYDCQPAAQRSYLRTKETEPLHFTVLNPNGMGLTFVALDNCLFKATDETRCDFMIGNNEKICFVEIKQVKKSQRNAARSRAGEQLGATIEYFKSRTDLSKSEITAIICLKAKQVYPVQSAAKGAAQISFKEKYGHDLREGQSISF